MHQHPLETAKTLALNKEGQYYLGQGRIKCPNRSELADGLKCIQERHTPEPWLPTTTHGEVRVLLSIIEVPQGGVLYERRVILFVGRVTVADQAKHLIDSEIAGWLDFLGATIGAFSVLFPSKDTVDTIYSIENLGRILWSSYPLLSFKRRMDGGASDRILAEGWDISVSLWADRKMRYDRQTQWITFFEGTGVSSDTPVEVWGWINPSKKTVHLRRR